MAMPAHPATLARRRGKSNHQQQGVAHPWTTCSHDPWPVTCVWKRVQVRVCRRGNQTDRQGPSKQCLIVRAMEHFPPSPCVCA